jgi:hypothetical protein
MSVCCEPGNTGMLLLLPNVKGLTHLLLLS